MKIRRPRYFRCGLPLQGEKTEATKRAGALRGATPDGSAKKIRKTERAAPPAEATQQAMMGIKS